MSTASLAQINIYPVKSLGGLAISNAWVEKQGLVFDRRFMLKDRAGNMITARKYPVLVTVRCTLIQDGLVFTAAEQLPFTLNICRLTAPGKQKQRYGAIPLLLTVRRMQLINGSASYWGWR